MIESLELETVQEEAEDAESVNESGSSSNGGDTLQRLGKYKHASSDNVSLTSLQGIIHSLSSLKCPLSL